jgi:hypothetical protein
MGRNFDNALDRWTNPGSILPLTPYEIWQMERYGNFVFESNPVPHEPEKTWFENKIEIFEYDEIHNQ